MSAGTPRPGSLGDRIRRKKVLVTTLMIIGVAARQA